MIPYFKWFPAEMEAETNFRCMTLEERGLFITCLNLAWVNNGLPSDLGELARMLRVNRNKLGRLWRGRVGFMFEQVGGRLRNTRQELDRQEVEYKSLTAAESANARWKRIAPRIAPKNDSQCLRTDTDTDTKQTQKQNRTDADFVNDWNPDVHIGEPGQPGHQAASVKPIRPTHDSMLSNEELEAKYGPQGRRLIFLKEREQERKLTPDELEEKASILAERYAQAQKQA